MAAKCDYQIAPHLQCGVPTLIGSLCANHTPEPEAPPKSAPKKRTSKGAPTAAEKQLMFDAVAERGTLTAAAQAVGVSRSTAARWVEADPDLAELLDEAAAVAVDSAEEALLKAARAGSAPSLEKYLSVKRSGVWSKRAQDGALDAPTDAELQAQADEFEQLVQSAALDFVLSIAAVRAEFEAWERDGNAPPLAADVAAAFLQHLTNKEAS
jgi:hypothetical protein